MSLGFAEPTFLLLLFRSLAYFLSHIILGFGNSIWFDYIFFLLLLADRDINRNLLLRLFFFD